MIASDDGQIAPLTIALEGKTYVESKLKAAADHYPVMAERGWADASCHAVASQFFGERDGKEGTSE